MPHRPAILCALMLGFVSGCAMGSSPSHDNAAPSHPRLLATLQRFDELRDAIRRADDPVLNAYWTHLCRETDRLLAVRPVERRLNGPRLLGVSREALQRVSMLALRYRIERDPRFADRAILELLAIAAFEDWNPAHFLDVAEMVTAVAIGYDWLHDELSPAQRATLCTAIINKALQPGLDAYRDELWWTNVTHNWAQVTAGGLAIGALAVRDESPDIANQILAIARTKIEPAMRTFAPDGGCAEGPGYWRYATQYNVLYLAAIENALGRDHALHAMPGFDVTGDFRIATVGPTGRMFNFADSNDRLPPAEQMFWLARTFNRPDFAAHERKMFPRVGSAFHLLWYTPAGSLDETPPPLDRHFRGVEVVSMRSDWTDNATYLALKAGDNTANHAHLDLGTFVLDALGQRWILDPGADNYNIPNYSGQNRWTFFRTRTEAHNTSILATDNQSTTARATIDAFRSTPDRVVAIADLSSAYPDRVRSLRRAAALLDRRHVVIVDELLADAPVPFASLLQTDAKVTLADDGRSAVLRKDERSMYLTLAGDAGARLSIDTPVLPSPQRPIPDHKRLTIRYDHPVAQGRIIYQLSPDRDAPAPASLEIDALLHWAREETE
ncbi:MAG TPA: heparinase II/III family protein [Tepidisphaeraceae bacterium]|nr:heparinase II/III family protein [Tepidisphaeraceae bacterium]